MVTVEIQQNFHIEEPIEFDADGKPTKERRRNFVRSERVEVSEEAAELWIGLGYATRLD